MPIEFGFTLCDESNECDTYLVEPDEGIFLSDYSQGHEQVLAISCDKFDGKGEIRILNPEDILGEKSSDGVYLDKLPEGIGKIAISENFPYEQEFIDEEKKLGTLRVRYVRSDRITPSFNVPMGLSYPN
jgi:hypothetical protein